MTLFANYKPCNEAFGAARVAAAKELGVYTVVAGVIGRNCPAFAHYFWCGRRFGGLSKVRYEAAWELRRLGLTWSQIGHVLGLNDGNARKGAAFHERTRKLSPR
jgi:hypothetical protein